MCVLPVHACKNPRYHPPRPAAAGRNDGLAAHKMATPLLRRARGPRNRPRAAAVPEHVPRAPVTPAARARARAREARHRAHCHPLPRPNRTLRGPSARASWAPPQPCPPTEALPPNREARAPRRPLPSQNDASNVAAPPTGPRAQRDAVPGPALRPSRTFRARTRDNHAPRHHPPAHFAPQKSLRTTARPRAASPPRPDPQHARPVPPGPRPVAPRLRTPGPRKGHATTSPHAPRLTGWDEQVGRHRCSDASTR